MPSERCPICGKFMKETSSRRWEHRWKCDDCGIIITEGRIERDEWFPNVGKE